MLKVCLNGDRSRQEHRAVPLTAAELAADAVRCVTAGAGAVHLHPRDHDGRETLAAPFVTEAVAAVRAACPGVPVGITTGAWIAPDPRDRVVAVRSWRTLPDFASVNAHEPGAEQVAAALHERGIGVEAGLWTPESVAAYRRWRVPVHRVLLECLVPDRAGAMVRAEELLTSLGTSSAEDSVLLHAEGPGVWEVLRMAVERGLDSRIGLEDTVELPDGSTASGNEALVTAAIALGAH